MLAPVFSLLNKCGDTRTELPHIFTITFICCYWFSTFCILIYGKFNMNLVNVFVKNCND